MEILYWNLFIAGGFLLGSIMFCEYIPKKILHKDIYKISVDNNPGAFNVFKHCGKRIGIPCLILDMLKGFLPVFLACYVMDTNSLAFSFVMAAPVLGHALGVFNHLHGGKCIATSFGVLLGLIPVTWLPVVTLAAFYILFSTLIKIKNASIRSVVVYALFIAVICTVLGIFRLPYAAIGCGFISLLPIVKFLCSKNGLVKNDYHDEPIIEDEV